MLGQEARAQRGHGRQPVAVVLLRRFGFPEDEQVEKLELGGDVVRQLAEVLVDLEPALVVELLSTAIVESCISACWPSSQTDP